MNIDVLWQARGLCQGLLLGATLGAIYDGMRILRCRLPLRILESLLDLLFWLLSTVALFLWSQSAWEGQIRLYGVAFCLVGGWLYFHLVSRLVLYLGYRVADIVTVFVGIMTIPLAVAVEILKIFEKLVKNIFLSGEKWSRIERKPEEMERAVRRRAGEERSGGIHEMEAGRIFDQNRHSGPDDLHGHLASGYAESTTGDPCVEGSSGKAGSQSTNRKSAAGRRRKKQR